jgi:putative ABC transport system permease protein
MPISNLKPHNSRSIFWRLCLRSLQVKRPQAALGIGSLMVGAAVCSLLLNLYGGVQRKMTESFSAFGANIILTSRETAAHSSDLPTVMPEPSPKRLEALRREHPSILIVPVLYVIMRLNSPASNSRLPEGKEVVAVGTALDAISAMNPNWHFQTLNQPPEPRDCAVGVHLAEAMQFHPGDSLQLQTLEKGSGYNQPAQETFRIATIVSTGASEDDQVFVPLVALQQMAGLEGKVSAIELRVPGDVRAIESVVLQLAKLFPQMDARPVRQIVYSEAKVLGTVSRLMLALTVLILTIIALCVASTMTAIVLERRKDIAVMKALGASNRAVMELFVSEGVALGLVGGLAGFFMGALFAREIALRLFDVALAPSWWVFPVVCLSTVILAVVATLFPVRVVRRIQPAVVLKGA